MERCLGCMEVCSEAQCPGCGYVQGTPPKEIYHLKPGTVLYGKYTVGKVLGYGGFGVTYIGWDNTLERKVAIKEFLPGDFSTRMPGDTLLTVYEGEAMEKFAVGLERFTQEAQRLARFNGIPGIVSIYDTFIENNTGYIVMELLEGQTVKEMLRETRVLPFEKANDIIKAVLSVLREVHKSGIIHRDISPDNIFVTKNGEIKVIDFGAARYAASLHSKGFSVVLKPGYAPEEQYRSRGNQGPWSDVYAVAATYYKLLTGQTIPDAMKRVAGDRLKPPSSHGAVLPKSAENAIMNALIVDADQRTRSAEDFLRALESDAVERTKGKQTKADSDRTPLWLKIAAPILGLALVIFLAVFVLPNNKLSLSSFISREVQVPNVINKTEEEAKASIEGASLTMNIVGQQYDDKIEAGRVLTQTPAGGALLAKEGMVEILMSGGSKETTESGEMPYVQYTTEAEAKEILAALGVTVNVTYEQSETVEKGLVMHQPIAQGTALDENTTVTLTVSLGPPPKPKKQQTPIRNPAAPTATPAPPAATPSPAPETTSEATSEPTSEATPAPTPDPTPAPTLKPTPPRPGVAPVI